MYSIFTQYKLFIVSICRLTLYAYFANVNTTYKNKNFLINYA